MALFRIERHQKALVFTITSLYLLLAALFFTPADIPHKLCFPVGLLAIASLWLTSWEITLALTFSALGDLAGSYGNFPVQMGSFAIAHILYIVFFIRRYFSKVEHDRKLTTKAKSYLCMISFCIAALLSIFFLKIVPCVPGGPLRIGVCIYGLFISTMLLSALLQRSSLYALGSVLFVFSDFILAWNKFVEPIPGHDIYILSTYFLAQWLIFIRATPYRISHPIRLMRF